MYGAHGENVREWERTRADLPPKSSGIFRRLGGCSSEGGLAILVPLCWASGGRESREWVPKASRPGGHGPFVSGSPSPGRIRGCGVPGAGRGEAAYVLSSSVKLPALGSRVTSSMSNEQSGPFRLD
jgi:hypothetical protein